MSRSVFALLLLTGVASAQVRAGDTTVRGCYRNHLDANEREGQLRVVSDPRKCAAGESPVVFDIQGPTGPRGVPGPVGPVGPAGAPGAVGDIYNIHGSVVPGTMTYWGLMWGNAQYPLAANGGLTDLGAPDEDFRASSIDFLERWEYGAQISCRNVEGTGVRVELWLQVIDANNLANQPIYDRAVWSMDTRGTTSVDLPLRGVVHGNLPAGHWRYQLRALCSALGPHGANATVGSASKVFLRKYYDPI